MLGIIPARGGSKRILGKNVRNFLGKPLIALTIGTAKESGVFDRIILLTDSEEIAGIGKQWGAEVPFMEPAHLADDNAHVSDALRWALEQLAVGAYEPKDFILLEPSTPGREAHHIREVADIMQKRHDFDSLVGISEVPGRFSHLKQLTTLDGGFVGRVGDGALLKDLTHRNQDVKKSYYINSAIYGFRRKNLFEGDRQLWGESTYGYVMDDTYLSDIDTEADWLIAEFKVKHRLRMV